MRRRSAQQKCSLAWAAAFTSGHWPLTPRSSRAPGSSVMYFFRISRFTLGSGNFVLSQSSMRPLRSSISAIQWTFCAVSMMTTSPFVRDFSPREVMPSMLPKRKRKMSEPRWPSSGRHPPMTMSASSMKITAGAAAFAAAKSLMISACRVISPTRKNFPFRRCASQRPTVVLPVPGLPWTSTPRLGVRPSSAAFSGFSMGKSTCFSNSSLMLPRPGYLLRSTASTSSGATAELLTRSDLTASMISLVLSALPPLATAPAARACIAARSAGVSCECKENSADESTALAAASPRRPFRTAI
mmetsp:Transcript_72027/g.154177  ORF Transcript_72027/g.154177 Transcript_72027/m.154177 type:complete len:299 (+) Transcript_72027:243-1139(+)